MGNAAGGRCIVMPSVSGPCKAGGTWSVADIYPKIYAVKNSAAFQLLGTTTHHHHHPVKITNSTRTAHKQQSRLIILLISSFRSHAYRLHNKALQVRQFNPQNFPLLAKTLAASYFLSKLHYFRSSPFHPLPLSPSGLLLIISFTKLFVKHSEQSLLVALRCQSF